VTVTSSHIQKHSDIHKQFEVWANSNYSTGLPLNDNMKPLVNQWHSWKICEQELEMMHNKQGCQSVKNKIWPN